MAGSKDHTLWVLQLSAAARSAGASGGGERGGCHGQIQAKLHSLQHRRVKRGGPGAAAGWGCRRPSVQREYREKSGIRNRPTETVWRAAQTSDAVSLSCLYLAGAQCYVYASSSLRTMRRGSDPATQPDLREAELRAEFALELRLLVLVEDGDGRDRLAWEKQHKKVKQPVHESRNDSIQYYSLKTCCTCRKYLSNTDLRSGWSSMASCSILSILLLNSFISLSFMSFSSEVSALEFLAERISLVSFEH